MMRDSVVNEVSYVVLTPKLETNISSFEFSFCPKPETLKINEREGGVKGRGGERKTN